MRPNRLGGANPPVTAAEVPVPTSPDDRLFGLHDEEQQERRLALIDQLISPDIEFYGVSVEALGRAAFDEAFRPIGEGARLVRTSAVEQRGGWLRCRWQVVLPDGAPAVSEAGVPYGGVVISQLDDQGRFVRLVPFLGDAPPAE